MSIDVDVCLHHTNMEVEVFHFLEDVVIYDDNVWTSLCAIGAVDRKGEGGINSNEIPSI